MAEIPACVCEPSCTSIEKVRFGLIPRRCRPGILAYMIGDACNEFEWQVQESSTASRPRCALAAKKTNHETSGWDVCVVRTWHQQLRMAILLNIRKTTVLHHEICVGDDAPARTEDWIIKRMTSRVVRYRAFKLHSLTFSVSTFCLAVFTSP